ncbi:MarR family transcriptional regulator [Xanthomonas nasturtii]|uniref:MarR family transcriptional regulator n=1 Tax=Xanthomonas nasturtii TaxID=1843581 RepID=A0A3E1KG74_9XANT|nr:MarR family transcriptional regulator [Xanthomonas nasturtii]MCL1527008.1 MarR family transcriptional regulator [Xanthomonas nasturtii]MCL1531948.1 MarR family transcriptional regulator [Xanthomonas nasturtii]MCL1553303.1 MarR family transcriptional regulator [Xanthomonas nasturtii]MCL1557412.1 MarR family transcriptional regulator [Xanthomonas nasturtii]MCL1561555.1 MarR family transcriptional regulator [Xanthomonas nasturtii]
MSSFDPTASRVDHTCVRYPAFPREPAVLVRLIKHLYKRLHTQGCVRLKPYGISPPEYEILMMLYGTPEQSITPTEVAEAASEKPANITRLTDQLCAKGLITRASSAEDRRKIVLTLLPAGLALVESLLPDACTLLNAETASMSEAEQVRLEKLLKKLLDGVDAVDS